MRPGGVVSLKRLNKFGFLQKNKLLFFMGIAFIAGIIIGSISVARGGRAAQFASYLFERYYTKRQSLRFFNIFSVELIKNLLSALTFFVFGVSIIGVISSPIFCMTFGIYFGSMAAYAYSRFALQGVAFNSVVFVPSALAFSICLFFAAKESSEFSSVLLKLILPKSRPLNVSGEFRLFCGRILIIALCFALAALIDAAVSVSFIRYFSF